MSIGRDAFVDEYFDEGFAKWKFSSSVIFDLGFYFPRFSLLAFYYELFPTAEKRLRLYLHMVTAYAVCAFFTTGFVDLFWCGADLSVNWADSDTKCTLANCVEPMYINWSIGIASELLGKCSELSNLGITNKKIILVFALPFGILKLKALRTKDRRALFCIFLLGIFTLIISAVRFYLTVRSIWSLETCKTFPWVHFYSSTRTNTLQILLVREKLPHRSLSLHYRPSALCWVLLHVVGVDTPIQGYSHAASKRPTT
ncbi:archaeal flagellin N-terminal-like domain-containing protein [Colletotrichum graminicola]|nr:archaeal flagellin N-terminal-like domain-containing protein [Colletotrichum graminicola]